MFATKQPRAYRIAYFRSLLLLRLAAVVAAWLWRFVADGKKVQSPNDLFLALDKYRVGDIVDVSLLRDGKTIHAKVPLEAVQ